jgi:hypothetical protein
MHQTGKHSNSPPYLHNSVINIVATYEVEVIFHYSHTELLVLILTTMLRCAHTSHEYSSHDDVSDKNQDVCNLQTK